MIPMLTIGQSNEKSQKEAYRGVNQQPTRSYTPPPSNFGTRLQVSEYQQKQTQRDLNRQSYNNKPGSNRPTYITDPYWNYWGPNWGWGRTYPYYGWNYYDRFWWNDSWGYRNPGRIYVYSDGKKDTVKIKPLHGSFGVSYNKSPEFGMWGTLGREMYFITEYSMSYQKDNSTYYPNITRDEVISWKDKRLNDYVKSNLFSLGVGKRLNKTFGLHAQIGFGSNTVRQVYFDEFYVLSNNGKYSIKDYSENITTLKIGTIMDYSKHMSVKVDYDVSRKVFFLGAGVRF